MSWDHLPHRWQPFLSPQEGRLWRILWLAAGDVVEYDELQRRLSWTSRDHIKTMVHRLRRCGYDVRTLKGVGLRLVTA